MKTLILITVALVIVGCDRRHSANATLASHDGRYLVSAPLRESLGPPLNGKKAWTVTITDTNGTVQYSDTNSALAGWLMVYWGWDPQTNRLWLYNSDDGRRWRWEQVDGTWHKIEGEGTHRMPDSLLPEYARKK